MMLPRAGARLFAIVAAALLAGAAGLLSAACESAGAATRTPVGPRSVIQNAGSDTMVNVAQAWAEEYAAVEPSVSVEVSGGGSGTGIAALINGTVDLANSSRKMAADEFQAAAAAGHTPVEIVTGYDALAVYVHRDNPLERISLTELAEVYGERGKVTRWSQLGVRNHGCREDEIILVSRQSNSGTFAYFREALFGKTQDMRLGTLDLHGSKDVVELVGRTPCAIGYSGLGYRTTEVRALAISKTPGDPAFPPSSETTISKQYPIARPLFVYTSGTPSPSARAYINWILSDAGQQIVEQSGYVPLPAELRGRSPIAR
jgi:phosphate transport system substrate-binding protein